MTEILIVVGLIVLMIALAVPTFNLITGNRSVDGAQNNISAFLGRARVEAIGLGRTRGVFFFQDLRTGGIGMALVEETDPPTMSPAAGATFQPATGADLPAPQIWLDLVANTDFVMLPRGVACHVIDDAFRNAGARISDGYIGFNNNNQGNRLGSGDATITPYGGVILFDASGHLSCQRYAFKTFRFAAGSTTTREPTRLGDLLYRPAGALVTLPNHYQTINDVVPLATYPPGIAGAGSGYYPKSHLGIVLFDREAMRGAIPEAPGNPQSRDQDWQFGAGGAYSQNQGWDEASKEFWLDENGLFLLVNRYNGTLVRGE